MTNVEELCDKIIMLRDGKVILDGSVQEVRNRYGENKTLCI